MASSSSHHIKNICVFGGSSPGKEKEFLESALAQGDLIEKTIGEEVQVPTMSDRMNTMFNHADAFIALGDEFVQRLDFCQ